MIGKKFIYVTLLVGLGFSLSSQAEPKQDAVSTLSADVQVKCRTENNSQVIAWINSQDVIFPVDDQVCAKFINEGHKGFHCGAIHVDLIIKTESTWLGLQQTTKVIDFQNADEQEHHGHC